MMENRLTSAYRLQLSSALPFVKAMEVLDDLRSLGVDGIYLSPFYAANSDHGYDVIDPNRPNPKLGTKEEFDALLDQIKSLGFQLIIDVIPNHMGIVEGNLWWEDVVKRKKKSPYASFFDICWDEKGVKPPFKGHYRRFFNIDELAAIRIEEEAVFKAHHKWVLQLVKEKKVQGLRIDHPDGLFDPKGYFCRLKKEAPVLTIVEKILARGETLPPQWEVEGTVGYEYMALMTALFVDQRAEEIFTEIYHGFIGETLDFETIAYESKKQFAKEEMGNEIKRLAQGDSQEALLELIAHFPVYRTYVEVDGGVSKRDEEVFHLALSNARKSGIEQTAFDRLEKKLFLQTEEREWVLRFQQLTAPVMAKGIEDTAFYRYNRLLSLNEVGSDPTLFGVTEEAFHTFNQRTKWKESFLASSTHDTKRSEDVRMRLNVLSELPFEWERYLLEWAKRTEDLEKPTPNTEYYIYQTLLGSWPLSFERLWQVVLKSIREAKEETSWIEPNEVYEQCVHDFLEKIMEPGPFLEAFLPFQEKIDHYGRLNSLSALVLKMGSTGIVDIYEGNENFTYRLVDPDNRAPVDFGKEGDEKMRVTKLALHFRRSHPDLFLKGKYIPLESKGELIAFARVWKKEVVIIAAGRFFTRWEGGEVLVPPQFAKRKFKNLFLPKKESTSLHMQKEETIGFFYEP
ncbi:MAG: Maltooligosyl trehalose synthase [Chlamydiales bacterium]|nr:Maltooligosyl trehalose synthase [Chlamydiales bacterium]MCH9620284.1 Maltooligosyl trehalose synthase [Chlamydiales bacterium]MCH9622805.1 Maltooligosyl trehalose synthase [Chlamydiales bacterium]